MPTVNVLNKNIKNIFFFFFFLMKFVFFTDKNLCILHGQVFVMNLNYMLFILFQVVAHIASQSMTQEFLSVTKVTVPIQISILYPSITDLYKKARFMSFY